MTIKLAIIDGTGEWSNSGYASSMAGGFCKQLDVLRNNGDASYYQRGPSAMRLEDAYYMNNAIDWLRDQRKRDPGSRLMLAGYSRGASTVMAVAEKLDIEDKIAIDAIFLFDAVARQVLAYGRDIMPSTKFCAHAIRSDDADIVSKYESYAVNTSVFGYKVQVVNPVGTNKMRPYFGHVGLSAPAGVKFVSRRFRGSHGALGGVGWKDVAEDEPVQRDVAAWMNVSLRAQGVPVALISNKPSS